jgi:hypothetical protein
MLDDLIPQLRLQVAKAQKILPEDVAASVEKVYNDILLMRNFAMNEFQRIQDDANLSENDRNVTRRQILEKAITKLEILKSKRSASDLINKLEAKLSEDPGERGDRLLKFMKEREIRDRLAGMTESQILSHFEKSKEMQKKLRRVRGKHLYPEIVAQLEAMQEMNTFIVKMFTIVRAELDKLRRKYLPIHIVKKSA